MHRFSRTTLIAAAILATQAHAATDGTLGLSSTGSLNISLTAQSAPQAQIRISGLTDVNFGSVQIGQTPAPITQSNICVHMTLPGTYSIVLDGGGSTVAGPDGFLLGSLSALGYDWIFTDRNGLAVTGATGAGLSPSASAACGAGQYASLQIAPREVTETGGPGGIGAYTGSLTLIVSPE
jgi:spore coat protein U-like protein